MRSRSLARATILFVVPAALLVARLAHAQATILVPPTDPAYVSLDRLVGNGLVDRVAVGQRPISRRALAHIVLAAASRLRAERSRANALRTAGHPDEALEDRLDFLDQLVDALAERADLAPRVDSLADSPRVADGIAFVPLRSLSLDLTRSTSPERAVPRTNGLGEIDATLDPLLSGRGGRALRPGTNVLVESSHSLETRHLAILASPALLATRAFSPRNARTTIALHELQVRLVFGNLAVDAGREYRMWGQGRDVGLLGSTSAPPLDLLEFSSEEPFRFPWILRALGPSRIALFYADLGAEQSFPHAYFVGYKLSIQPAARLELGTAVYTKSGGHGAPRATLSARILDAFPFLYSGFFGDAVGIGGNFQFSDRYAGVDARLHFPALRGASLYGELLFNDFDVRRLRSVLWEDAGHVAGLELPRLTSNGVLAGTLELHHTGVRYYEHEQFLSGQTLRRTLLGDPLGPDALGAYATFDWDGAALRRFTAEVALERRSNDQYRFLPLPAPRFGFERVESRPKETRARAVLTWHVLPRRHELGATVETGYERTQNFDFVSGARRSGTLARVGLDYRFR